MFKYHSSAFGVSAPHHSDIQGMCVFHKPNLSQLSVYRNLVSRLFFMSEALVLEVSQFSIDLKHQTLLY